MFLGQLTEKEKVAFIQLAHFVAKIDGSVSDKEQEFIDLYIKEAALSEDHPISDSLQLHDILEAFVTTTSKNIALIEVLALIFSDGIYDDEERKLVKEIKQELGISSEKYEAYKAWIQRVNAVYAEGVTLISE
ncbi:TerB family tellurite resistance protein [Bacillus sp. HMF5848]|uniref:TerB family tellurite resistance protein n=1 Tax=Bacillus sp. HMF5848 TaxID=2495421 RepID=UPI000F7742FB|nr:TerB family tellurite resistance protein [Bacillus sp. HMF5848]RSK28805.1 TerB family tellurite resistance protein [Bacillus sp. HMF5848]